MKKLELTYQSFYDLVIDNPDKDYFIETHNDKFTKINAVVKKTANMLYITFDTGYMLECADSHAFMGLDGESILAQDLHINSRILSTNGTRIIKSIKKSKNTEAFDINIDSPHWYINDEHGIIHHNTFFCLILAKAYMDKYPESILIFYDCEFGTPESYFDSLQIDKSRILHTPIMNMEEFKFDVMNHLENIGRDDKVVFVVDSLGNMSSKREKDNALDGKSVLDLSRAKEMKSIFRMITPYLVKFDIPMIAVNHIYMCGTKDMLVTTENGPVSLKDIEIGCNVLTTNGFEPVLNKFNYNEAFVTDIEMEDGSTLSFTSGHKFKVNGKWVLVEDLHEGMYLDII